MSCCLRDSLKTDMDDKQNHVLVFTTNKTLNERFTPKFQRSVFMLNNGCTAPFKNNVVKGRIVFPNKKTNEIPSSFTIGNMDKNILPAENELIHLAKNRRVVLMPVKLEQKSVGECIDDKILPSDFEPKVFDSSTPKYNLTSVKSNLIAKRYSGCNKRSLSGQNHYFRPSVFNWKRKKLISKDELDDEIDAYMSDVKMTTAPNKVDDDAFIKEYFMETENFLQEFEFLNEMSSE